MVRYGVSVYEKGEHLLIDYWECWASEIDESLEKATRIGEQKKCDIRVDFKPREFSVNILLKGETKCK